MVKTQFHVQSVVMLGTLMNGAIAFLGWRPFSSDHPGGWRFFSHYQNAMKMRGDPRIEELSEPYFSIVSASLILVLLLALFFCFSKFWNLVFFKKHAGNKCSFDSRTSEGAAIRDLHKTQNSNFGWAIVYTLFFAGAIIYPNPKGSGWLETVMFMSSFVSAAIGVSAHLMLKSNFSRLDNYPIDSRD